jgi:hypothetical protein
MLSSLDVIWATRVGGGGRTERSYLDFMIDGVSLCSRFSADFIPALGWLTLEERFATIERLTRKIPPNLAYNRTSLCICPECSDRGCSVIAFPSKVKLATSSGRISAFRTTMRTWFIVRDSRESVLLPLMVRGIMLCSLAFGLR